MTNQANHNILVVDDEEAIRFFVSESLSLEGWQTGEADSGEAALEILKTSSYDIVLLDLRMPGMDGMTFMREVKKFKPDLTIIVMTAYATLDSAIEAVQLGASDYLLKPCDATDIISCIHKALENKAAMQQRWRQSQELADTAVVTHQPTTEAVHSGGLVIDLGSHRVALNGSPLALTPTEYELLAILARAIGEAVSLKQLIQEGLGYDPQDAQAVEALRVHISRLRSKLGADYILTVRGGGYLLALIQ